MFQKSWKFYCSRDGLTLDDAFVDEDESLVESSSYTISEVDSGDGSTSEKIYNFSIE